MEESREVVVAEEVAQAEALGARRGREAAGASVGAAQGGDYVECEAFRPAAAAW